MRVASEALGELLEELLDSESVALLANTADEDLRYVRSCSSQGNETA